MTKETSGQSGLNLSIAETVLSILIAIIGFGQLTVWLYSSSQVAKDQSHVEFINLLVEQAYQDLRNPNNPLCIYHKDEEEKALLYVICDSERPVAEEEYEQLAGTSVNRLLTRRLYDDSGKGIMAIERYEYSENNKISKINRVIFQNYLWAIKCAYIETNYGPDGIVSETRFHGACGAEMVEIPSYRPMRLTSPPPVIFFIPYR